MKSHSAAITTANTVRQSYPSPDSDTGLQVGGNLTPPPSPPHHAVPGFPMGMAAIPRMDVNAPVEAFRDFDQLCALLIARSSSSSWGSTETKLYLAGTFVADSSSSQFTLFDSVAEPWLQMGSKAFEVFISLV
jgi:hypothetical protein